MFEDVAGFQDQLIRKALRGAGFVAPYATAALETISGADSALVIPTGYVSLGKLTSDGAERSTEQEVSSLRGWGDSADARRDIDGETNSVNITAMETKKRVIELYENVDLTGLVPDANGEISFDKPATPISRDWRFLCLAKDINKANGLEVYCGIHFLKTNFSQNGSQNLQPGDNALQYPLTANALHDPAAGTAVRIFWAGPGLAGLTTAMGFVA
jgi:hypothetical protein